MYLVYKTRLDIALDLGQLSKYYTDLRKDYFPVVKRVVLFIVCVD